MQAGHKLARVLWRTHSLVKGTHLCGSCWAECSGEGVGMDSSNSPRAKTGWSKPARATEARRLPREASLEAVEKEQTGTRRQPVVTRMTRSPHPSC